MRPRQREVAAMYKRMLSRDYSDTDDVESIPRDYVNTALEEKSGNVVPCLY